MEDTSMNSILKYLRRMLVSSDEDDSYDTELLTHINTYLMVLTQDLGVGPEEGFVVTGTDETWDDFIPSATRVRLEAVKTYMYLKVRMIFDPPTSTVAMDAMQKEADNLEWRLTNSQALKNKG